MLSLNISDRFPGVYAAAAKPPPWADVVQLALPGLGPSVTNTPD